MSYPPPSADPDAVAAPQAVQSTPPSPAGGLAIAALVVGIVAALTGWVFFLGLVLGLVGVVLGILAIRKGTRRGFGISGLVLSGLAVFTNVALIIFSFAVLPALLAVNSGVDSEVNDGAVTSAESVSGQSIVTPCYSFDGPSTFISNQSNAVSEDCYTTLELWGEISADGTIVNTGVGEIFGSVGVEPVRISVSETMAATGDLDGIVEALSVDYIPKLGTLISLKEAVTLGDQPSNVTRVKSTAAMTKTKAIVVGFAPNSYENSAGTVQLFIISVVTPYDNGDALIDAVVSSWSWKEQTQPSKWPRRELALS